MSRFEKNDSVKNLSEILNFDYEHLSTILEITENEAEDLISLIGDNPQDILFNLLESTKQKRKAHTGEKQASPFSEHQEAAIKALEETLAPTQIIPTPEFRPIDSPLLDRLASLPTDNDPASHNKRFIFLLDLRCDSSIKPIAGALHHSIRSSKLPRAFKRVAGAFVNLHCGGFLQDGALMEYYDLFWKCTDPNTDRPLVMATVNSFLEDHKNESAWFLEEMYELVKLFKVCPEATEKVDPTIESGPSDNKLETIDATGLLELPTLVINNKDEFEFIQESTGQLFDLSEAQTSLPQTQPSIDTSIDTETLAKIVGCHVDYLNTLLQLTKTKPSDLMNILETAEDF